MARETKNTDHGAFRVWYRCTWDNGSSIRIQEKVQGPFGTRPAARAARTRIINQNMWSVRNGMVLEIEVQTVADPTWVRVDEEL